MTMRARELHGSTLLRSMILVAVSGLFGRGLTAQTTPLAPAAPAATAVGEDALSLEFEHAGGMIRGSVPTAWSIVEQPAGREVRLVLSPEPLPPDVPRKGRPLPASHLWLTVHAQVHASDLRNLIERRLTAAPGVVVQPAHWQAIELSGYAGAMASLAGGDGESTVHAIVATPWGLVEWHVESRDPTWTSHWRDRILANWRIAAPRVPGRPAPGLEAASAVIGAWKARRSRMRVGPDGRFQLVWDKKRLTESGAYERVLNGRFEASGDLLLVTFDDGSQRNYRWRRSGPWLLLTDHEGRIAQLRYIYE